MDVDVDVDVAVDVALDREMEMKVHINYLFMTDRADSSSRKRVGTPRKARSNLNVKI